jgi:hypothetical protein
MKAHSLLLSVLLGLAVPALAGAQRLLGPPLLVDDATRPVTLSSLAMSPRGDFVVAWIRQTLLGGDVPSLLVRKIGADGTPRTDEIVVVTGVLDNGQNSSKVAISDDGSFVVVFPAYPDLVARRYGPDGMFEGQSVVASQAAGFGYTVSSLPNGGFVLAWLRQTRTFARTFGPDGQPSGPERQVGMGGPPAIAVGPDGGFVVAWIAARPDPHDPRYADPYLVAQRYDATSNRVGGRILVQAPTPPSLIYKLDVAEDGDGDFLVLWQARISTEDGIYARRYSADGTPLTGRLKLEGAAPQEPQLAMDRAGNFVVAWFQFGAGPNGQTGAFAQRFTAGGAPFRPSFRVDLNAGEPLVASDANGNFVVAGERLREILVWRYRKR